MLAGGGAELPRLSGGRWAPCGIGSAAAFRWVAEASGPDEGAPNPTALHRIFVVPDGEPMHALMDHIASLRPGERLYVGAKDEPELTPLTGVHR